MKKNLFTLLFAGLAAICFGQEPAIVVSDKSGWHKIGETTVDFQKEQDEVAVLLADRFASLKFKVTGASIQIEDIDVIFEEGDSQNIRIGSAIKPEGNESRPIDLKGGSERKIKRIVFRYKTVDKSENQADRQAGKKAHLEIWGKKTNPDKAGKDGGKDAKKAEKASKKQAKKAEKDAKEVRKEADKEIKKND